MIDGLIDRRVQVLIEWPHASKLLKEQIQRKNVTEFFFKGV